MKHIEWLLQQKHQHGNSWSEDEETSIEFLQSLKWLKVELFHLELICQITK